MPSAPLIWRSMKPGATRRPETSSVGVRVRGAEPRPDRRDDTVVDEDVRGLDAVEADDRATGQQQPAHPPPPATAAGGSASPRCWRASSAAPMAPTGRASGTAAGGRRGRARRGAPSRGRARPRRCARPPAVVGRPRRHRRRAPRPQGPRSRDWFSRVGVRPGGRTAGWCRRQAPDDRTRLPPAKICRIEIRMARNGSACSCHPEFWLRTRTAAPSSTSSSPSES